MKINFYEVIVRMGSRVLPLQGGAAKILGTIGISPAKFIEKHGANSSYDFYWKATQGGVEYQVRGDRWEKDEKQATFTVSLIGVGADEKATKLYAAVQAFGWNAELVKAGTEV